MRHHWLCALFVLAITASSCSSNAGEITLVSNKSSEYTIVIPARPSPLEERAASIFQSYIQRISGMQLPVEKEGSRKFPAAIYIGDTRKSGTVSLGKMVPESYKLQAIGKDIVICAGSGKGLCYGVYGLLEHYLHCKKIAEDAVILSSSNIVSIPGDLHEEHRPQFQYREVYYPASQDAEYLEWNQLQRFEDLWGVWGHSYNKLVPAQTYFKAHPEYYALVKGVRQPSQLCLSNEAVFDIATAELKKRIAANPDAMYWSVSPNDDNGYCECDKCKAVDNEAGSPSGSLINFVNRIAAEFPDKNFTTLAYGYTHRAPRNIKPAKNVYIFLSNIDAFRDKPLADEGSAGAFRNDLRDWSALTPNIFVWDYITQFTSYLAPFPNFHTLQANIQYMRQHGVKGIFAQGSGDTYGEFAELRSYVEAKLLENDTVDVKQLVSSFVTEYYGPAGKYVQQYIDMMQDKMIASKRKLDIYGNPINQWNAWLSPQFLDTYSGFFDKAEAATESNARVYERVTRALLPLEYTVLQQARFYGIEKFGIFVKDDNGEWIVKPKLKEKVSRFVENCKKAKVTELSEGGLTPDAYQAEWNAIFAAGVTPTKAVGTSVSLKYPFAEDFPAKGSRTLIDGNPGYTDFSYNWLGFYGVPMEATVDLGKVQDINSVKMHFLDDPRHWIFIPGKITVESSTDGVKYTLLGNSPVPPNDEHYEVAVKEFAISQKTKARYIRVTADNLPALPSWRMREHKKPMIACDEIFIQ